jgi:hypothetical protein
MMRTIPYQSIPSIPLIDTNTDTNTNTDTDTDTIIAIMTTPLVDINDLENPVDDEEEYDAFTAWLTLDEEAQRLDNDTAGVMEMRVAPSTRSGYLGRNITFMVWLFDRRLKYDAILEPTLLPKLEDAYNLDRIIRTKKGKQSKKREHLRNVCRESLVSIVQSNEATVPVKLEKLSFEIFSRYLGSFKKTVKTKKPTPTDGEDADAAVTIAVQGEAEVRLAPSSYDGACSALAHLFIESFISRDENEVTKDLWTRLSRYKKGMRRKGAQQKGELGLSLAEGKKPLPFVAYKLLAKILFESDKPEHVAAHTFLILEWNLIARAEFVVDVKIDAIYFQNDAIMIDMGKTKTDQDGTKNIDHPWHLYANSHCPYICPVLAIARLLINNPIILAGHCDLFEGSGQYDRLNKILGEVVSHDDHRESFAALGIPSTDFGTHSIRKGAVTHISTGTTSCPPISSICLRANWALPGVTGRYIKYENAGDQFVGRCVSGLPRLDKEFASSPAYFDFSSLSRSEREQRDHQINGWIKDRMPEEAQSNDKVFLLFKMCIASIGYHHQFLEENLHSMSNIRSSIFMLETMPLQDFVTVKYPWNSTVDTPDFTGIPADILIIAKFESVMQKMEEMEAKLCARFEDTLRRELDERKVGGTPSDNSRMADITNMWKSVMETLKMNNNNVNKSGSGDDNDDGNYDYNVTELFHDESEDAIEIPNSIDDGTSDQLVRAHTKRQLKRRRFTVGFHHNKFNILPAMWRYPKGMTLIHLINLWLIGAVEDNIPPLGELEPLHFKHFDSGGRKYSQYMQVMTLVEKFGRERDVWLESSRNWDGKSVTVLWSAIWQDMYPYMRTKTTKEIVDPNNPEQVVQSVSYRKSRSGQISARTVYNKLGEAGVLEGKKARKRQKR